MSTPEERVEELTERNERLSSTLREARDQLIEFRDLAGTSERLAAIDEALDYAILAVDMRITEIKQAVARGTVGTAADRARLLAGSGIAAVFEAALRAAGYEVVPEARPESEAD